MKKLTLTIVCALAVTGAALAQGTLMWSSFVPTAITAQTNATVCSPLFGGGSTGGGTVGATAGGATAFYYELLYNTAFTGSQIASPTLAALTDGSWIDSGLEATNTGIAGRILPIAPSTQASVAGWAGGIGSLGGKTNNIVLVGWSANLGTSWSVVSGELANWGFNPLFPNAYFGESTTGYLVPNQGNPGCTVFVTTATLNGLPINSVNTQLYLLPTPEPSTIALAGLGGFTLLLFRRRKQ